MAKIAPPPPPNTFSVKGPLRMCPNMKFLFTLNAYVVQVKKHLSTGVLSVRPSLLFKLSPDLPDHRHGSGYEHSAGPQQGSQPTMQVVTAWYSYYWVPQKLLQICTVIV